MLTSQGRNDGRRWHAAMPQDVDGTIARWREAGGAASGHSLLMRPANAAKRCRVPLLPSRGSMIQDGPPDDSLFQVRKAATFPGGLRFGRRFRRIDQAPSGGREAPLERAMNKIVALIIRVRATLFRVSQR